MYVVEDVSGTERAEQFPMRRDDSGVVLVCPNGSRRHRPALENVAPSPTAQPVSGSKQSQACRHCLRQRSSCQPYHALATSTG